MSKSSIVTKFSIASILGVLGFVLSIVSLFWNWEEHKIKMEEYELSQVPVWQMDLIYDENNIDLLEINFTSRNDGVILQGLDILTPTDFVDIAIYKIVGNRWKCYDFTQEVFRTADLYFSLPEVNLADEGSLDIERVYPIAVRFKYLKGEKQYEYYQIYLVHLFYYTREKVKFKQLELFKKIRKSNNLEIRNVLDDLNAQQGFVFDYKKIQQEEKLTREYSKYKEVKQLLELLKTRVHSKYTFTNESNSKESYQHDFLIPQIYFKNEITDTFKKTLKLVVDKKNTYDESITDGVEEIESFLLKYPIDTFMYNNQRETIWTNDTIRKDYDNRVMNLVDKYNVIIHK